MKIHPSDLPVLKEMAESEKEVESRPAKIVLMAAEGVPVSDIAARLQITPKTVYSWIAEYEERGVQNMRRRKQVRKRKDLDLHALRLTGPISAREAARRWGVSPSTATRHCADHGFILKEYKRRRNRMPLSEAKSRISELLKTFQFKNADKLLAEIRHPIARLLSRIYRQKSDRAGKRPKRIRLSLFQSDDLDTGAMEKTLLRLALQPSSSNNKTLLVEPFAMAMVTGDVEAPPRRGIVAVLGIDNNYTPVRWIPLSGENAPSACFSKLKEVFRDFGPYCQNAFITIPDFCEGILDASFLRDLRMPTVLVPNEQIQIAVVAQDFSGKAKAKAVGCGILGEDMRKEKQRKYYLSSGSVDHLWIVRVVEAINVGAPVEGLLRLKECLCLQPEEERKLFLAVNWVAPDSKAIVEFSNARFSALQSLYELRRNFGLGKGRYADEVAWCKHKLMVSLAGCVAQRAGLSSV